MWCCFGEHRDGQEEEEGFFLENGGRYNPFRIFSIRELSAATNKYHSGGILHKGFTYILYECVEVPGMLLGDSDPHAGMWWGLAMILHMMFVPDENESGTMISNLEEIEKEAEILRDG
ncbi:hypothetical protein AAG906_030108 [Vitis piasezkii]